MYYLIYRFTRCLLVCAALNILLQTSAVAAPPSNDEFASAINLGSAYPASGESTNIEATIEPNEPKPFSGNSSVWWRWTATFSGMVEINTIGSTDPSRQDFPLWNKIAVYTGDTVDSLTAVANDSGSMNFGGLIYHVVARFSAIQGTTYSIQVCGYNGTEGHVSLHVQAPPSPPANDAFSTAASLPTGVRTAASLDAASIEPQEPGEHDTAASAWWLWQAPADGWYQLEFDNLSPYLAASVWTGNSLPTLSRLLEHEVYYDGTTSMTLLRGVMYFQAQSGEQYPISLHSRSLSIHTPASLMITSVASPALLISNFTLSRQAVDVSEAAATVTARFQLITHEPFESGLLVLFTSGLTNDWISQPEFRASDRVFGSQTNGWYEVPIPIAQGVEPGILRVELLRLLQPKSAPPTLVASSRRQGNIAFPSHAPREIQVINTQGRDVSPPVVVSITTDKTSINMTETALFAEPQFLTVSLRITDDLSGFKDGNLMLSPLDGSMAFRIFPIAAEHRISGDARDGLYSVRIPIESYQTIGEYEVFVSTVTDNAWNSPINDPVRVPVSVIQKPYYETWLDLSSLSASSLTQPGDDPDGDGSSNLMEFAVGTHPAQPDWEPCSTNAFGLPRLHTDYASAGSLQLEFWMPLYAGAMNLTFVVQFSSDGQEWTDQEVDQQFMDWEVPILTTPLSQWVYCRVNDRFNYLDPSPTRFARLKVIKRPIETTTTE